MKTSTTFERYEIKYLLNKEQQAYIMNGMTEHMIPDSFGHATIRNIYFDTPDYILARRSMERPQYKEKLRVRSYKKADSNHLVFVELKKKYKSIVYKRRITLPKDDAMRCISDENPHFPDSQIGTELEYVCKTYKNLEPAVFLSYDREAFYDKDDDTFRITFDRNILYRTNDLDLGMNPDGIPLLEEGYALMELKVAGGLPMWMIKLLSDAGITKTSFSKYVNAYKDIYNKKNLDTGGYRHGELIARAV